MNSEAGAKPQTQAGPVVALIGLDPQAEEVFQGAFSQFGIRTETLDGDPRPALAGRHFDGCVLRLHADSLGLLESLRASKVNRNIAILGIADSDAQPIAKLGLNAIIKSPVQRAEVVRAVQGTHLLILHELRRYVRVPIVLEVALDLGNGTRASGLTRDVSYGGLSISTWENIYPDADVETSFTLPDGSSVQVRGRVVWRHNPELIGVRFAIDDQRRKGIRNWIDDYLEMY
jgi:hypothetical protein